MLSLLIAAWLTVPQALSRLPIDATRIEVGTPIVAARIDTGTVKGDVRRLCWSPDGGTMYLQTAEGNPPLEVFRHYAITAQGGAITALDGQPDWAASYWAVKQDRVAPGIESLRIEVVQGNAVVKGGAGESGVLNRGNSSIEGMTSSPSVDSLAAASMNTEHARVVRLTLLGMDIATWTNERPYPGARFSWGPSESGALVCVGDKGQLVFIDQRKQKKVMSSTKDAVLPAWSADGRRVAYLQKAGRKKYLVVWAPVGW
jgi:hypothetical protein